MSESHVVMGEEGTEKGLQEKHCMLVTQNLALTEKHQTDRLNMTLGSEYKVQILCLGLDKQGQILSSGGTKAIGDGRYIRDHLKRSVISSSVAIFLVSALVTGKIVFSQT